MSNQHAHRDAGLPASLSSRSEPRRTVTAPGHVPGDYLHPEQSLEIVDEQTGHVYQLYVRSNAAAPAGRCEISVFIPVTAIQSVQADTKYCVVTLSRAANVAEERARTTRLPAVFTASADSGLKRGSPARKRRTKPPARRSAAHLKVKR